MINAVYKKTRGECFLVTLAGLGCLAVVASLLVAGGYFYYRNNAPTPVPSPVSSMTPEIASTRAPEMRLEDTALGEDQAVVQRRFPQMVLKEAQTVPLIFIGNAHGEGSADEPTQILFRDGKVTEIRFAKSLEVNRHKFLAREKPSLDSLSQALGVKGEEGRLTPLPPTFWQFEWDDRELSVVILETGHFFSLDSRH